MTDELATNDDDTQLDAAESGALEDLEEIIRTGLGSFVRVGMALKAIRDGKLYRDSHKTFEDYCRERWGFTRANASLQIVAADVVKGLSTIVDKPPQLESHVRPLTRLADRDQQVEAWNNALARSNNDPAALTAAVVREEVAKFLPPKAEPSFDFVRERDEVFRWLLGRLAKWPDEYRGTFAEFVAHVANDIQEQQRED